MVMILGILGSSEGCQRIDPLEGTARGETGYDVEYKALGCQRIDPLEGTARKLHSGGYHTMQAVARGETRWRVLQDISVSFQCETSIMLPEDRPVGGYCKVPPRQGTPEEPEGCQRIDPLEGTARY